MAEYIEREALLNAIPAVNEDKQISLYGAVADFMVTALSIPPADVVEVKHGEWITPTKIKSMTIPVPHCSLCGNVPCDKAFYCPYCGAKMDLKEGAEE